MSSAEIIPRLTAAARIELQGQVRGGVGCVCVCVCVCVKKREFRAWVWLVGEIEKGEF